jgi:hypothetical protein
MATNSETRDQAIKALMQARSIGGGKMLGNLMMQILSDKPSAIVKAWEKIRPEAIR